MDKGHRLKEHPPNPKRRGKMGQVVTNLGKFAVDLVVRDSRKFVTGAKKVYQMVQEGLKELPVPVSSDNETKQDNLKQESKTLSKLVAPSKKKDNEGVKAPILLQNKRERIFIRSRL